MREGAWLMGRIVTPFDGGRASMHMLAMACETAVERADEVEAVYVLRVPAQLPIDADLAAARARADAIFARAYDVAGRVPLTLTAVLVEARHLGSGLVAAAEGCDLLMLGLPARRGLVRRLRFRPTLRYVLAHAPCEVLVGYVPPALSDAPARLFLRQDRARVTDTPGAAGLPHNVRVLRLTHTADGRAWPSPQRSPSRGGSGRG